MPLRTLLLLGAVPLGIAENNFGRRAVGYSDCEKILDHHLICGSEVVSGAVVVSIEGDEGGRPHGMLCVHVIPYRRQGKRGAGAHGMRPHARLPRLAPCCHAPAADAMGCLALRTFRRAIAAEAHLAAVKEKARVAKADADLFALVASKLELRPLSRGALC